LIKRKSDRWKNQNLIEFKPETPIKKISTISEKIEEVRMKTSAILRMKD
jgi:hypothetical protein